MPDIKKFSTAFNILVDIKDGDTTKMSLVKLCIKEAIAADIPKDELNIIQGCLSTIMIMLKSAPRRVAAEAKIREILAGYGDEASHA